jgi:hypothetical protein
MKRKLSGNAGAS